MKKTAEKKNNAAASSVTISERNNLYFAPARKVFDAEMAQKKAAKCTDYNDSRSDARNFKCVEINGVKLNGEDLSGIEAHYSKFVDCEFTEVNFSRMEAQFAAFENCIFTNCDLSNANFSFGKLENVSFFNCNLNGIELSFAFGNIAASSCMMERASAQNANKLNLVLSSVNAYGFEANFAALELDVVQSNLRRCEFNDSKLEGKIKQTDLSNGEMNRADMSNLTLEECPSNGLETEDASGFEDALEKAINELMEDDED